MPMYVRPWIVCGMVACALTMAFAAQRKGGGTDAMARIAQEYVRLVLAMGQHDKDYVDAYYGPEDVKKEAERAKLTLDDSAAGGMAPPAPLHGVAPPAGELDRR